MGYGNIVPISHMAQPICTYELAHLKLTIFYVLLQ